LSGWLAGRGELDKTIEGSPLPLPHEAMKNDLASTKDTKRLSPQEEKAQINSW